MFFFYISKAFDYCNLFDKPWRKKREQDFKLNSKGRENNEKKAVEMVPYNNRVYKVFFFKINIQENIEKQALNCSYLGASFCGKSYGCGSCRKQYRCNIFNIFYI